MGSEVTSVNPIALTAGFRKGIGEIEMSKILRDGSLIVGERRGTRGVITGIPVGENLEELRKVLKGDTVT